MAGTPEDVRRQLRRLPAIRRDTLREIQRQLEIALRDVIARLATAKVGSRPALERLKRDIELAIGRAAAATRDRVHAGQASAWGAGEAMVRTATGVVGVPATRSLRALDALKLVTTDRIKDASLEAIDRINTQLAQVIIGARPMHEAITEIQAILSANRRRAMTIAYTNIGAAYSAAAYARMQEDEAAGVKLAKRWLQSGKLRPRPGHVHAHGQIRRVSDPFEIVDPRTGEIEFIRFPRDPQASARNVINCGCLMVPVVDGSIIDGKVAVLTDDPVEPVRYITREERAADNATRVAQVQDRLSRYLQGGDGAGLQVTTTLNARPLLDDPEDGPPLKY